MAAAERVFVPAFFACAGVWLVLALLTDGLTSAVVGQAAGFVVLGTVVMMARAPRDEQPA